MAAQAERSSLIQDSLEVPSSPLPDASADPQTPSSDQQNGDRKHDERDIVAEMRFRASKKESVAEPIVIGVRDAEGKIQPRASKKRVSMAPVVGSLNETQVRLQTSKVYKTLTIGIILSWCFFDILGTCLFEPAGPILCQQADGGPIEQYTQLMALYPMMAATGQADSFFDSPPGNQLNDLFKKAWKDVPAFAAREGKNISQLTEADYKKHVINEVGNPRAFQDVPARFSTAVNLLNVFGGLSGGVGQAVWGAASDSFSKKLCMLVCCVGGLCGYIIMYIAGTIARSFWLYSVGLVLNGFFTGSMTITMGYFTAVFGREEAASLNGAVMSLALIGGAVGGLILMPFIQGRGERIFDVSWLGIGATALILFLIAAFITDPIKRAEDSSGEMSQGSGTETGLGKLATPKMVTTILWIAAIGNALDGAGDEGTRISRGTILQNAWPSTNDLMFQNVLLMTTIVLALLSSALLGVMRRLVGLAWTAVIGCFATMITQLLLNYKIIPWKEYPGYIACWYGGKLFGFLSTFASFFIINSNAPEDQVASWSGRMQGLGELANTVSTLSISLTYDHFNDGTLEKPNIDGLRGVNALFITAAISFIGTLTYAPLIRLLPKEIDKAEQEKRFRSAEEYEALTPEEWKRLSLEEVAFQEERKAQKEGDSYQPRIGGWGIYVEELSDLDDIIERTPKDLDYFRKLITAQLTDPASLEHGRQMQIAKQKKNAADPAVQKRQLAQKQEMGSWIADYFTDAGYDGWDEYPVLFKAMIMNAFPALGNLDGNPTDYERTGIEDIEMGFLKVLDQHLAVNNWGFTNRSRLRVARGSPFAR